MDISDSEKSGQVIIWPGMKTVPRRPQLIRWGVFLLQKKAIRIGSVEAVDSEAALVRALTSLEIEARHRHRLSVQPEG